MVKGCVEQLLRVMFNHCVYREKMYIYPKRETFREWYNKQTGRNVCIGTIDRYIRDLKDELCIKRVQIIDNLGVYGKRFSSSLTFILKPALHVLHRMGIEAFEIVDRISGVVHTRKKRALHGGPGKARKGEMEAFGDISGEVLKHLKPG